MPISGSRTLPANLERPGLLHDLPDQQPVVGPGQRVVVVGDADRALDPPVRRVQPVGVALALAASEAGLGDLVDQLLVGVDPDVAALDVVVVLGQLPVDDLGEPSRHRDRQRAAGSQHPDQLLDRLDVGRDVLEHLGRDHPVELAVGEGQLERVALLDVGLGALGHLTGLPHRVEQVADAGELVGVHVEGDHVRAAPVHLEGVPAGAAAHVEHAVSRAQPEAVEVNGQHGASFSCVVVGDRLLVDLRRPWPRPHAS